MSCGRREEDGLVVDGTEERCGGYGVGVRGRQTYREKVQTLGQTWFSSSNARMSVCVLR